MIFQPIQIILLAALLLSVALVLLVLKNQIVGRVFFVSQFFLGCLFVLWPDLSSRLASLLGVGRGTDLLLYFLILFVYVSSLCLVAKFRRLQESSSVSSLTPPVPNKLKVASVSTNFVHQAESTNYVLDLSKVPAGYQNEIKFYTVNGLRYLGLQEVAASDLVLAVELLDSHLHVVSANPRRERKTVSYQLTATEKGKLLWTAKTSCTGRASDLSNNWFPGLVASFLPYYGETKRARLTINKYPIYLDAVSNVVKN